MTHHVGIPLIELGEAIEIDITVGGADEVAPNLYLVKEQPKALGLMPALRMNSNESRPIVPDNGNLTLDCALPETVRDRQAARDVERALNDIAGIVDTGFFPGTADQNLVRYPDGRVDTLRRTTD